MKDEQQMKMSLVSSDLLSKGTQSVKQITEITRAAKAYAPPNLKINSFVWGWKPEPSINSQIGNGIAGYDTINKSNLDYNQLILQINSNYFELFKYISQPGNQQSCGSCWLFSTAQVLSDMLIIQYYYNKRYDTNTFELNSYAIDPAGLMATIENVCGKIPDNQWLYGCISKVSCNEGTGSACPCGGGVLSLLIKKLTNTDLNIVPSSIVSYKEVWNNKIIKQPQISVKSEKASCCTVNFPDAVKKAKKPIPTNIIPYNHYIKASDNNGNSLSTDMSIVAGNFLDGKKLGETYQTICHKIYANGPCVSTITVPPNFFSPNPITGENPFGVYIENHNYDYSKSFQTNQDNLQKDSLQVGGHAVAVIGYLLVPIGKDLIEKHVGWKTWTNIADDFFKAAAIPYKNNKPLTFSTSKINMENGKPGYLIPALVYRNSWGGNWGALNGIGLGGYFIVFIPPFSFRIQPLISTINLKTAGTGNTYYLIINDSFTEAAQQLSLSDMQKTTPNYLTNSKFRNKHPTPAPPPGPGSRPPKRPIQQQRWWIWALLGGIVIIGSIIIIIKYNKK